MPKKRPVRFLSRWRFILAVLVALQIAFLALLLAGVSTKFRYAGWAFHVISVIVSLHIFNRTVKSGFRFPLIFFTLLFPIFGGCIYLVFYIQSNPKKYRRLVDKYRRVCTKQFRYSPGILDKIEDPGVFRLSRFLQTYAGFPLYEDTYTEYFPSGEAYLKRLVPELEKAGKYIFVQSFIIEEGIMFDTIFEILKRKASAGLDVRVMYDDLGCFATLPDNFAARLEKENIRCLDFHPFKPILSSLQNNRSHRKIISIDGKTAFTGGVNIGDEYINTYEKYGHWKDSAIMVSGGAAWSLTMIFLAAWNMEAGLRKKRRAEDNYPDFYPESFPLPAPPLPASPESGTDSGRPSGFVQPYSDSPIIKEYICETVYMNIINSAKNYLYISTPYLIPDESVISALAMCAKSGTDVRIMTPHRPDKPLVLFVTRSYYRQLIKNGIRIYEYTRGFNHSKTFVSDDIMATVGTVNLDHRSLYLDYECAVFLYKTGSVKDIKEDFLDTLKECKEITLKDCARNIALGLLQDFMRIFAPLM